MNAKMLKKGDRVEVRNYVARGEQERWEGGYVVRSVEREDVVVEREGQAFAIGDLRVRPETFKIVWSVRDAFLNEPLASFFVQADAAFFSRGLNGGESVPRFCVDRSHLVAGKVV